MSIYDLVFIEWLRKSEIKFFIMDSKKASKGIDENFLMNFPFFPIPWNSSFLLSQLIYKHLRRPK